MSDPNEELVEELARAIMRHFGLDPDVFIGMFGDLGHYDDYARAMLPIIARVRDEALEEAAVISDTYYNPTRAIRELKGKP